MIDITAVVEKEYLKKYANVSMYLQKNINSNFFFIKINIKILMINLIFLIKILLNIFST